MAKQVNGKRRQLKAMAANLSQPCHQHGLYASLSGSNPRWKVKISLATDFTVYV